MNRDKYWHPNENVFDDAFCRFLENIIFYQKNIKPYKINTMSLQW